MVGLEDPLVLVRAMMSRRRSKLRVQFLLPFTIMLEGPSHPSTFVLLFDKRTADRSTRNIAPLPEPVFEFTLLERHRGIHASNLHLKVEGLLWRMRWL